MSFRPNAQSLARTTVLIVDDSRPMRDIMRAILRALDVGEILTAAHVPDALAQIRRTPPDLIFVDWCMQPMGGLDLVREVRTAADSPCPFVPIVMCTGHTEQHHVMTARDAGVTEFLAKPVSVERVAKRIEEIIHRPRRFVRARAFFGPDRRRVDRGVAGIERRGARDLPQPRPVIDCGNLGDA